MTGNRRIPFGRNTAGFSSDEASVLTSHDLNPRYLSLDRAGRITINLEQLKADLDITVSADVGTFTGAGTTGVVPDPATEDETRFLRDDGEWAAPPGGGGSGSGDVVGPASATDDNLATYDGATGKLIQDSGVGIAAVNANTAKVTNATHTGEVTGSGALSVDVSAITNQTSATPAAGDEVLLSDAGVLRKADVDDLATASSLGGSAAVFKAKSGLDLQFRGLSVSTADGMDITENANDIEVGLTVAGTPPDRIENDTAHGVLTSPSGVGLGAAFVACSNFGIICKKNSSSSIESVAATANNRVLLRGPASANNMNFKNMSWLVHSLLDDNAMTGTAFPTGGGAPVEGWPFYRSDLHEWFVYNADWSAWVGTSGFTVKGYRDGTVTANGPFDWDWAGTKSFASGEGFPAPYTCKPAWASIRRDNSPAEVLVAECRKNGTGDANSRISISSGSSNATDEFMTGTAPTSYTAGQPIELYIQDDGGSPGSSSDVRVVYHFRRIAT